MWRFLVALMRLPITIIAIPWFALCSLVILLTIPIIVPVWMVTLPFVFVVALLLNDKAMLAGHMAMPNTSTTTSFEMIARLWSKFWRLASGAKLDDDLL
jgi:hypothetical protein